MYTYNTHTHTHTHTHTDTDRMREGFAWREIEIWRKERVGGKREWAQRERVSGKEEKIVEVLYR